MRDSFYHKNVSALSPADLELHPVWEYMDEEAVDENDESSNDSQVTPATELPVLDARGKVVGTRVQLANGLLLWATLVNLSLHDCESTKHFLMLSVFQGDQWVHLARYHDPFWDLNGPTAFSRLIGLDVNDIFPISYDVSDLCVGDPLVTRGLIPAEPVHKLAKADLLQLALRA